jgi:hypothetical protein
MERLKRFCADGSTAYSSVVRPPHTQSRTKPALATLDEVIEHAAAGLQGSRWKPYAAKTVPAFGALTKSFTVAQLLDREVRSGAIHERSFGVDARRFFNHHEPYVDTIPNDWAHTLYLSVFLPGRWLIDLLRSCVENYKTRLLTTRQLPRRHVVRDLRCARRARLFGADWIPDERTFGLSVGR